MANSFKVLIDFNSCEKYCVIIESNYKLITFNSVYNEIIKQTKLNISLQTHIFEV